jgi:hypothetical protein
MLLAAHYKLYISEAKLSLYLLNPWHPDGSSKARFFLGQGFKDAATLQHALMQQAQRFATNKIVQTPFGLKYIVDGTLQTPSGKGVMVRCVWIVLEGTDICTFVTAYPL